MANKSSNATVSFSFVQKNLSHTGWSTCATYKTECFVLAFGYAKHYRLGSDEISDTVISGYRLLMRKLFYVEAQERLIKQLGKISKRKLAKLQRIHTGLNVDVGVIHPSTRTVWVGLESKLEAVVIAPDFTSTAVLPSSDAFTVISFPRGEVKLILLGVKGTLPNKRMLQQTIRTAAESVEILVEQLMNQAVARKAADYALLGVQL